VLAYVLIHCITSSFHRASCLLAMISHFTVLSYGHHSGVIRKQGSDLVGFSLRNFMSVC